MTLANKGNGRIIWSSLLLGGIAGAIIFVLIYGVSSVNVTNVDWIYARTCGGDNAAYQFGWEFYRNDDWHFPIGYMANLRYGVGDRGMGILYMDPIPLFAVFFKLFRGILPAHFQYLGLWHLLCFILQGALSCSILRKYLKSTAVCVCLMPLLLVTPFLLWRTCWHTALVGHWVIFLALFIWAYKDEIFYNTRRQLAAWVVATALTIWIQIYFLLPVGIAMFCFLLEDWLENKNLKKALLIFFCCVGGVLLSFWQLGGFTLAGGGVTISGLGRYSMNLLSFFDSDGYSRILPDIPSTEGNYEGWQYLGLSGILLLFAASAIAVYHAALSDEWPVKERERERERERKREARTIAVGVFFFVTAVVALSPIVYLGTKVILDYSWFSLYTKLMAPFRCSGRTFWISTYVVLLFSIVTVFKRIRKPSIAITLALAIVAVQLYDISPLLMHKYDTMHSTVEYTDPLASEVWDDIASNVKHVYRLSYSHWDYRQEYPVDFYATRNNLTLNNAYIGRNNDEENFENIAQGIRAVMTNNLEKDTLYCISDDRPFTTASMTGENVVELHVDGYYLYIHKELWDRLDQNKYQDIYMKDTGEYLTARAAYLAENAGT